MVRAAAFVGILVLLAGGSGNTSSHPSEARARASAPIAAVPASTVRVPTSDQLEAALLDADDLGPAFAKRPTATPAPSEGEKDTRFEGCQPLAGLLNEDGGRSDYPQAAVTFQSRDGLVAVAEGLAAEPPGVLAADYAKARQALESCGSISLVSAGQTIKFSLTPIRFGGSDSSAVRMDATHRGVLINGYIAIEKLSDSVVVSYVFFQVGGGSSQLASHFYDLAADKARASLGL
nr:hypothetical protein [Streptomyces sp. SID5914]